MYCIDFVDFVNAFECDNVVVNAEGEDCVDERVC